MSDTIINSCEFITSAAKYDQLPISDTPEVAFIGRSNAGKSTLINRLAGQKNLAKVSAKPGKTRLLNLFELNVTRDNQSHLINLIDLPGYGYAKVSKGIRANLAKLVVDYFENRKQLKTVFLLSDSKRRFNQEDLELRDFLFNLGIRVQVVLTKADKLNQKELSASRRTNAELMHLQPSDLLVSSIKKPLEAVLEQVLCG